ncbi:OB-fold domain-containing protein [Spiroplasma endosymbiont of Crioceris asparagi]|uniref:OB-fold domain-containing protein n=1 Tax=Spiroplasma endosymbiont of Crioceris asparagi TaxID=3066286 RepID=UPI0030CCCE61
MYFLKGKIIEKINNRIIVENNNIGYEARCYDKISVNKNIEYQFYVYQYINEFKQILYFSLDKNCIKFIQIVMDTKGVGPKMINELLTNYSYKEIIEFVKIGNIEPIVNLKFLNLNIVKTIFYNLGKDLEIKKTTPFQKNIINSLIKMGFNTNDIYSAVTNTKKTVNSEEYLKLIINKLNTYEQ